MSFRMDTSDRTVVAVCLTPGCPWRTLRLGPVEAWSAAADHDRRAHDSLSGAAALAASKKRRDLR